MISFLGLHFDLKKEIGSLLLTILLCYICIFFIIFIKSIIVGDTFEDIYYLARNGLSLYGTIGYGLFCFFQEVLFRGIIQRFLFTKTNKLLITVVITTILFLICHYNYDIVTVIGALFISIVASITTYKDDNIYKAFFFHWIFGGFGYVFITLAFLK